MQADASVRMIAPSPFSAMAVHIMKLDTVFMGCHNLPGLAFYIRPRCCIMDRNSVMRAGAFALMFAIVVSVNYYVFDRTAGLLGLGFRWLSIGYALSLAALLLVGFLVRTSSGRGTKGLFVAVTTAYGLEFATLFALLVLEPLDLIFSLPNQEAGVAIVSFVFALAIVSAVNAQLLYVRTIRLPFVRRLRVVQISDIHIGVVHGKRYLAGLVRRVNALKPDLVLITGDIISGAMDPSRTGLDGLAGLEAPAYLAPGNHEFYEGMEGMRAAIPRNVRMLNDEEVDMGRYSIFGLDFLGDQGVSGARELDRNFQKPVIMMAHVPQFLDLPEGSIILSGHYHAGQVFPFNFLGYLFVKNFRGFHRRGGVTLYVSPGTATWGPPMRFGSRNEITLLELGAEH